MASALVDSRLIQHKDTAVSMQCARCIAEIIRICAPDAPYDDTMLRPIFALFMKHLENVNRVNGPDFAEIFELLRSLADVKCFILMAFADMDATVRLFGQFFDTVHRDHFDTRVAELMLQIMQDILMELEEVPVEILELILGKLELREERPEAYQLAKHLLARAVGALEGPVTRHLTELLDNSRQEVTAMESSGKINKKHVAAVTAEAQDHVFRVLYELFCVHPDLLLHVLPILESDLGNANVLWRQMVVDVLCRICSVPGSRVSLDNVSTFTALLDRFRDRDTDIRVTLVNFAGDLMMSHERVDWDNKPSAQDTLETRLIERTLDAEESVRLRACETISQLAIKAHPTVTRAMLEALSKRCIDQKLTVSRAAVMGLAQAYHDYEQRSDEPSADEFGQFAWIPASLLEQWESCPALVEEALDQVIFGDVSVSVVDRAHRLIKLLHSVSDDASAGRALAKLLEAKAQGQKAFENLLRLAPRKQKLDSQDEQQYADATRQLSHVFKEMPESSSAGLRINKIFELMQTSSVSKACKVLLDPSSPYKEIRKAEEHLEAQVKAKKLKPTSSYVCVFRRVSFALFNREMVPELFSSLDEYVEEDDFSSQDSLLQFLVVLSSAFPGLMEDSVAALTGYIQKVGQNPKLRSVALSILANAAPCVFEADPASAKTLKKGLVKIATSGTPKEAKYAVRAILGIYPASEKADLIDSVIAYFSPLPADGVDEDDDEKLEVALVSMTAVLEKDRACFTDLDSVAQSILEQVLGSKAGSAQRCVCIARALKFMSIYAAGSGADERVEKVTSTTQVLEAILLDKKFTAEEEKAGTASLLRIAATRAVLRIACERDLDRLIGPKLFEAATWIFASAAESQDAKLRLLSKLSANVVKLNVRFLCAAAVSGALDSFAAVRSEGQSVLARMIAYKRFWLKKAQTAVAQDPNRVRQARAFGLPEYATPHLVHLLAHSPSFDANNFSGAMRVIKCFFDAVLKNEHNFTFLQSYMDELKRHKDAAEPDRTAELVTVCEISRKYLAEQSLAKHWSQHAQPTACIVPRQLFRDLDENEKAGASLLPEGFELPSTRGPARGSMAGAPKTPDAKKRRVSVEKEEEVVAVEETKVQNEVDEPLEEAASVKGGKKNHQNKQKKGSRVSKPAEKKKKTPAKKSAKRQQMEEQEEEEQELSSSLEVEMEASPVVKKVRKTPVKAEPTKAKTPTPKKTKNAENVGPVGASKGSKQRNEPAISNTARRTASKR